MKVFEHRPTWKQLVKHTWVYARVSPSQKEYILTTLKELGFITLMAGDGTNDVGALKQAHIGVALLDGTEEDLQKIAERQKLERIRKVYESQLSLSARFNQPPPPVPPAIAHLLPDAVQAQQKAASELEGKRKKNPMEKFDLTSITEKLADMDGDDEVPKIKLGDASCAAPFTSKLGHVAASAFISSFLSSCDRVLTRGWWWWCSFAYYSAGAVYACGDDSDVQDFGAELFDYGV